MQPGDVVCRRFRLESLVGSGGMAAVFRARDLRTRRPVALKVAFGHRADDARRIAKEAHILARCRHPAVVEAIDHGEDGSLQYLALEWLEGETVAERLRRAGFPLVEALWLVEQTARALAAVHEQGFVHGDVKPENVFMVDGDPRALKLIDFGIAARWPAEETDAPSTRFLTPEYASPEQIGGFGTAHPRWDVYSLGCVLFECLTGRAPHTGETLIDLLTSRRMGEAPRPSDMRPQIPAVVDDLVVHLLSGAPEARPLTAAHAAHMIRRVALQVEASVPAPVREATPPMVGELRLATMGVVGGPMAVALRIDTTVRIADLERAAGLARLREICEPFGVRVELVLEVGALLIGDDRLDGLEQAAAVAQAALTLSADGAAGVGLASRRAAARTSWAMGDALEAAGRLARRANDVVLVDAVTAELLRGRFVFEPSGDAYRLVAPLDVLDVAESEEPIPLLGRDREIGELEQLYYRTAHERVPHAAIVVGEPGVGKSRLAAQLCSRIRDRSAAVALFAARADSIGGRSPFLLASAILRAALSLSEGESPAMRRRALDARLRALGVEDAAALSLHLDAMMAMSASGDADSGTETFVPVGTGADPIGEAFCLWLRAEAKADEAVVVLVDDLHRGDSASIRLLDRALAFADAAIYVVALARPEMAETFPRLWEQRKTTVFALAPLDPEAAAQMTRHCLRIACEGAVDEALVARITELARGNPFHLRALATAGRGRKEIPETVLAIVQAELDRLDGRARRILRAASVFFDAFSADALTAVLGAWHRDAVQAWLPEMEHERILERRASHTGGLAYTFRSELVRQAAYATLAPEDRRTAHCLVAEWRERTGSTRALLLAEHWGRGGKSERAAHYFHLAARQALSAHDFDGARLVVERAVGFGASGEIRGMLRLVEADAHEWSSDSAARERAAEEAIDLLEPASDAWFAAFEHLLGACAWQRGADAATTLAEMLDSITDERISTEAGARTLARTAGQLFISGRSERASALLKRATDATRTLPSIRPQLSAWLEWAHAWSSYAAGDLVDAFRRDVAAAQLFEEAHDVRNACYAWSNVGYEQMRLGLLDPAERSLRIALQTAEQLGLTWVAATAAHNLGLVLALRGSHEEAVRVERWSLTQLARVNPRIRAAAHDYLSRIHLLAGHAAAAEVAAREAASMAAGSPAIQALAHASRAHALLALGRVDEALAAARLATEGLASDDGPSAETTHVLLAHVEAALAAGEVSEAMNRLRRAHRWLMGMLARIQQPEVQKAFLRMPENARILDLSSRLGTG